ncbi:MAG: putative esterase, partial [Myxococcota bacterium]
PMHPILLLAAFAAHADVLGATLLVGADAVAVKWHHPVEFDGTVIVALHGSGSNPATFASKTAFLDEVKVVGHFDSRTTALVMPSGTIRSPLGRGGGLDPDDLAPGLYWNPPDDPEHRDDAVFLDTVVDAVADALEAPVANVLVVGFSQGGAMALTWACRSSKVDVVTNVAGAWQLPDDVNTCANLPPHLGAAGEDSSMYPDVIDMEAAAEEWTLASGAPDVMWRHFPRMHDGCSLAVVAGTEDVDVDVVPTMRCAFTGLGHAWPRDRIMESLAKEWFDHHTL